MSYNIDRFYSHDLQQVMALFLMNPTLYNEHKSHRNKQSYFFERFHKFAIDYNTFTDEDANVYFNSVRKEDAGEASICGGAGKISHSSKKYFKDQYKAVELGRNKRIDNFVKKYGVKLEPGNDARLFLGITEIWNHLDRAIDIVNASPYHDVLSRAYSDATLSSPIPETIDEDKTLIPLSIRLRVLQKFRNSKRKYSVYVPPILDDIEPHPTLPGAFIPAPVEPVHSGIVFVRPPGMDDDDW